MRITISGPPGSGKTTVAKLLAEKLRYPLISGGDIFRKMAKEKKMNLVGFGKYAEKHWEIDKKIDGEIVRRAKELENVIVDSRLSGWLMHLNNIPSLKVYINASQETRVRRLLQREDGSIEKIREEMLKREMSEKKRYLEIYGIDFSSLKIYDLVINSDNLTPEDVVSWIMDVIK